MRHHSSAIALTCVLLLSGFVACSAPACGPPATVITPAGQMAFTADQIVIRVNALQKAAIQAEATGGLSTAQTRIIVEFAVSANRTLKDTPAGWQRTVATAWMEAKRQLPATLDRSVTASIDLVDVVLAAY